MRPQILVQFNDTGCDWHSVGWGDNPELMRAAKQAINEGETPEEVIAKLLIAGFDVGEMK